MSPVRAYCHIANTGRAHVVETANRPVALALNQAAFSNIYYILFGELSSRILGSREAIALAREHVRCVLSGCPVVQMGRVAARWVVAMMANKMGGDAPVEGRVGHSGRWEFLTGKPPGAWQVGGLSVPPADQRPEPRPALVGAPTSYFRPEVPVEPSMIGDG